MTSAPQRTTRRTAAIATLASTTLCLALASCSVAPSSPDVTLRLLRLQARDLALGVGDTASLGVSIAEAQGTRFNRAAGKAAAGAALPDSEVSWTTSDSTVVAVSAAGLLTAKREGVAIIRARSEELSDSTTVSAQREILSASYKALSLGATHSCAIDMDSRLLCWGGSWFGELGIDEKLRYSFYVTPQVVLSTVRFTAVALGLSHSCALAIEGIVYCAGDNRNGQADGSPAQGTPRFLPVAIPEAVTAVSAGGDQTCAVGLSHALYCWGAGFSGVQRISLPGNEQFTSVSVGALHRCGVTSERRVMCWGDNAFGQLGLNSTQARVDTPTPVTSPQHFDSVSAGTSHTCAVDSLRKVWCWGFGEQGQLGTVAVTTQRVPTRTASDFSFTTVAAGSEHTCALEVTGSVWCWGLDSRGALGTGQLPRGNETLPDLVVSIPHRVASAELFTAIATGSQGTSCAIARDEHAFCWGNNSTGALAVGHMRWSFSALTASALYSPSLVREGDKTRRF